MHDSSGIPPLRRQQIADRLGRGEAVRSVALMLANSKIETAAPYRIASLGEIDRLVLARHEHNIRLTEEQLSRR
jgi:hypothetical protein